MGSRKEHIKKTLGITEYPWSSDDDDQPMPDVHLLRRQAAEPRPSVADMPGTSGQQAPSSPTLIPVKRNQGSQAEFFWSMQPNKSTSSGASRSRTIDSTRPSVHTPAAELRERPERASAAADIKRILAFKKLTRSMGSLRPNRTNATLYSMSSRGLTGTSRNAIFTPAMSVEVAASLKSSRVHSALTRLQAQTTRNPLAIYSTSNRICANLSASDCRNYDLLAPSTARSEPVILDEPIYLSTNDRISSSNDNTPVVPETEENIVTIEGTIVVDTTHNTSGAMSLEEEIVEIDAHDETDGTTASADNAAKSPIVNADAGLNQNATLDASAEAKRQRQEKKKRDDAEPVTVKQFNQNLLRLLECPVCLEWMEPPMSQCRRGHLVCGRCRARLASCPVCRTTFSSVRNRAMEGVAEMVRYPCRHSCGREVRLRRRGAHESSCSARRYACPAPACAERPPLPRDQLATHFQTKHAAILKMGRSHKFSLKVNCEQHDTWVVSALHEYFSLRVDVDIRTWGVLVLVAYIGPKCNASNYTYQVTVVGQHNSRKLVYARATHSDLESSSLNVSRQDCFHLTLDQALNFLRVRNRHCEPDKFLDFNVEISKCDAVRDDSDS